MKKELLIASALVSTMGLASVAEAASSSFSGKMKVGVAGADNDTSSDATTSEKQLSTFSVSISETTDSGIKISTGFDMAEEGSANDPSGLTLTFTDGSKLDLIEAGNASDSHAVSVPGPSGELGVTGTSTHNAPSGIDFAGGGDAIGFEYHTAADAFGIDGFKAGISYSNGGNVTAVTTTDGGAAADSTMGIGVTYVADAGDTSVTIGAGYSTGDYTNTLAADESVTHVGISAVTGDLTIAAGFASGNTLIGKTTTAQDDEMKSAEVTKLGVKYVSGDMTFNVGMASGSAQDRDIGDAADTSADDTYDSTGASVDYVVAPGVTATVGFKDESVKDEGATANSSSGSSWYVGATVSF